MAAVHKLLGTGDGLDADEESTLAQIRELLGA
jgi:hypothetical protein